MILNYYTIHFPLTVRGISRGIYMNISKFKREMYLLYFFVLFAHHIWTNDDYDVTEQKLTDRTRVNKMSIEQLNANV